MTDKINIISGYDDPDEEEQISLPGTTYYVKNAGNNGLDGLSDANAWQTIAKVNGFAFQPGDTVCFKRGNIWKEELRPTADGTFTKNIHITAYGAGARPIITARDTLTGWTVPANWTETGAGTNIWWITYSKATTRLWINKGAGYVEQRRANSLSGDLPQIGAADPYYLDNVAHRLYVYSIDTLGDGNPANEFTGMEVYIRDEGTYLDNAAYFTLSELDIRGGYYSLRMNFSNGSTIHDCNIGFDSSFLGLSIGNSNSVNVYNCILDSNSKLTYTYEASYTNDGCKIYGNCNNINITNNHFIDWGHSSIYLLNLDLAKTNDNINIGYNDFTAPDISYGRALNVDLCDVNASNIRIYNNYIHDMPTQNQVNCYQIQFFNNIINNITGVNWEAGVACGLNISMYSLTTRPKQGKFYNNVFANCADEGVRINNFWGNAGYFIEENEFINNIFFNNDSTDDYQLTIQPMTGAWEKILDNTYKNNLFYKAGIDDLISYRGTPETVAEFNAENGNAWNEVISLSITGDPLFVGAADFHIQAASAAKYVGIYVPVKKDFDGVIWHDPRSEGAYEFV
jgi:hypothetical protein